MSLSIQALRRMFSTHLSGTELILLIGDELPLPAKHNAEKHIEICPRCRARYARLNEAALNVAAYCDDRAESHVPRDGRQRDLLLLRLNQPFRYARARPRQVQARKQSFRVTLPTMNPTFATAIVLALASVSCIFVWLQQARPDITSNTLLVRAEAWDAASLNSPSGVIRQRVGIRTTGRSVYRTIYRDARGQRQPRMQQLEYDDEQLRKKLAAAGVEWDSPLSATAYQDWHDRQRVRQDQIKHTGNKLVLKTSTPDGLIAEQSFTVRDSDFHPVERTVVFRGNETIEIAELEYLVLPWDEVGTDVFGPAAAARAEAPILLQPALVPRLPSLLTESQLDEAELSARLVLDQLHADTGEQVRIDRDTQGVQVKGLVETDRRKEELQGQLRSLPHVSVAILSIEELNRHPSHAEEAGNPQMISGSAEASPLETYFLAQGRGVSAVSDLSQQLVDTALTVDQESRAITDLLARFGSKEKMTDMVSATLSELIFSHRERLLRALQQEQALLGKVGPVPHDAPPELTATAQVSLMAAAQRNLALSKELTLGSRSGARGAESIIAELTASIEEVRTGARTTKLTPRAVAATGGKD